MMQKLPIGIQHFTTLRQEGYLYVDKTQHIHALMQTGKFLFLSRPRRFGKSLLITTLREIYRGNRALFQNLWIEDKKEQIPAYELEEIRGGTALMDSANVNRINVQSLLFQTGYLTVKSVRTSLGGETQYRLGYPNHEVERAFQQHLLADYLSTPVDRISGSILARLEDALHEENIAGFINVFKSVFGNIPHTLFLPFEAYYHSVVYLVLSLLGFTIHAERLTNLGRLDAVLEMENTVYIIEFKMTTAEAAIQQVRDKGYDAPYHGRGKSIILIGIAFDKESRNIADWATERLA
jgi:hypothetical protein